MKCPSCNIGNIHPGYESRCLDCEKPCECGCGLLVGTVRGFSKHINREGEVACKRLMQYGTQSNNKNVIKTYGKFITSHHPQFKEVAAKYLILK